MRYAASLLLGWNLAGTEASAGRASEIEPAHLLMGLTKLSDLLHAEARDLAPRLDEEPEEALADDMDELRACFERLGVEPAALRLRLRALSSGSAAPGSGPIAVAGLLHRDAASRRAFDRATATAAAPGSVKTDAVRPPHLLGALLDDPEPSSPLARALAEIGVTGGADAVASCATADRPHHDPARAVQAQPPATPALDRYGRDLSAAARCGTLAPIVGRRAELRALARVLSKQRRRSAILLGDAGVGKTCIVEGLAQHAASEAAGAMAGLRIVEISVASLLAGTSLRGELEARVQAVVEEATAAGNVILFIDEIHTIAASGSSEDAALDVGAILKPALAGGAVHCIGATTPAEYRRYIERDPALERRFEVVWVDEPTHEEALAVLEGLRPRFAAHHGLQITDAALAGAVELSHRHLRDLRLPDKAIDVIDQACASLRLLTLSGTAAAPAPAVVEREHVAAVIAARCRLPIERVTHAEADRLRSMHTAIAARVVGQPRAVDAVCDAVRMARCGLRDPRRPAAALLFAGPTGTGKTELAKALAEFLFDDDRRLVRIDMSEYMDQHASSRLIGAPPGYIGHDREGQLTGAVRTNPHSVVLFDEIEKAHPRVLDLLLQLLDEGELTDTRGRKASFRDAVVILTTNLGGEAGLRPAIGFGADGGAYEGRERQIAAALRSALRPELIGRIGDAIVFDPLAAEHLRAIADKLLARLGARLTDRPLHFVLSAAAYELLTAEGYDPSRGARELERVIERRVARPLSIALLDGALPAGGTVAVDREGDELALSCGEPTRGGPVLTAGLA